MFYCYDREEQQRIKRFLEILLEADTRCLEKLIEEKKHREQEIAGKIGESDRKIFEKCVQRSINKYNLTQTAIILSVHRQTLYYWIKKGWCKPRRDNRN